MAAPHNRDFFGPQPIKIIPAAGRLFTRAIMESMAQRTLKASSFSSNTPSILAIPAAL